MDDQGSLVGLLRERLPAAFAGSGVRAAYLFGSQARGTATARSDVDLAVLLGGEPASLDDLLDLMRRVHAATGLEVDLTVLDNASLRLVHRILRDGHLVFSGDETARVRYEVRMRKLSGDYALHAEPLDRELLAAIAEGNR